jgi:hypothetical protein
MIYLQFKIVGYKDLILVNNKSKLMLLHDYQQKKFIHVNKDKVITLLTDNQIVIDSILKG